MSRTITAHDAIARAKPFIDDAAPATGWLPSELLTLGWCIIASGRGNISSADFYVSEMLDEARNRWAAGFYANPFEEPARVRPALASRPSPVERNADSLSARDAPRA